MLARESVASIPNEIPNLIDGEPVASASGEWLEKLSPATGRPLCRVARSNADDVAAAVGAARQAQADWSERTPVARAEILRELALLLHDRRREASEVVV